MKIQIEDVCKSFDGQKVLDHLHREITGPGILCLMGASGVGKTTLLRILLGLEQMDSGTITGLPDKKAAVFQEDRLCNQLDAIQNVRLAAGKHVDNEQIRQHFKRVMLTDYEGKAVSNLSGGMRRRVAIVRACLAESELLCMDEPLKGLDEETKQAVISYILEETKGKMVILVTHQEEEAEKLGGTILQLQKTCP